MILISIIIYTGGNNLIVLGVKQNIRLTEIGKIDTGGNTYYIQIDESLAVVSDVNLNGLKFYNVSNPKKIEEIGTYFHGAGSPHDTVIRGDLVYLADRGDGLEILNISDPTNPVFLTQVDTGGFAWGLQVSGNLAYVADNNLGLKIINISNPLDPTIIGNFSFLNCKSVNVINDKIAYVSAGRDGMMTIDVNDPTNCTLISSFSNLTNPWGLFVEDNVGYIADMTDGFKIVDVSDSDNPIQLVHLGDSRACLDVQIVDSMAFISEWRNGLEILDISDPSHPIELIQYEECRDTKMVFVEREKNLIFVADGYNGLVILQMGFGQSTSSFEPIFLVAGLVIIAVYSKLMKKNKRRKPSSISSINQL